MEIIRAFDETPGQESNEHMNENDELRTPPGSLFCGWLRSPSVLMCEEQDWDVTGQGAASRICGAGLQYNEHQKSFVFDFGGQMFTISKTLFRLIEGVLPTSC